MLAVTYQEFCEQFDLFVSKDRDGVVLFWCKRPVQKDGRYFSHYTTLVSVDDKLISNLEDLGRVQLFEPSIHFK